MHTEEHFERDLDVLVVGGGLVDILAQGVRLPAPGEALLAKKSLELIGGKGVNQAVGAARLGASVALISQVGADARGDRIRVGLAAEGVEASWVCQRANLTTGVRLIFVDEDGEKAIMTVLGASGHAAREVVEAARPLFGRAKVVLVNLELPDEAVRPAVALARRAGATVVLDPAPARPLSDDLLRFVDVLRPNAREATGLSGVEVTDVHSARQAARRLLERGVGRVVLAAGLHGNLAVWREGTQLFPRIPVHALDVTGAGDAFCAALSVALAEDATLVEACRFATAAAALATTVLGAQHGLPTRGQVIGLLEHLHGTYGYGSDARA